MHSSIITLWNIAIEKLNFRFELGEEEDVAFSFCYEILDMVKEATSSPFREEEVGVMNM